MRVGFRRPVHHKRPSEKGLGKVATEAHGTGFGAAAETAEAGKKLAAGAVGVFAQIGMGVFARQPLGFVD